MNAVDSLQQICCGRPASAESVWHSHVATSFQFNSVRLRVSDTREEMGTSKGKLSTALKYTLMPNTKIYFL